MTEKIRKKLLFHCIIYAVDLIIEFISFVQWTELECFVITSLKSFDFPV